MPFAPSEPVPVDVAQRKSVPPPAPVPAPKAMSSAGAEVGRVAPFSPEVPPLPVARDAEKRGNQIGVWASGPGAREAEENKAVSGSALAFSNAAAGVRVDEQAVGARRIVELGDTAKGEGIELIGFEAEGVSRMRKHASWKKLLGDVYGKAKLKEEDEGGERAKDAKDSRDVALILRRGEVMNGDGVLGQMWEGMEGVGYLSPLVLLNGELEMVFDEMEVLKATMVAVSPFASGDKKLKEVVDMVREVMGTVGIERARGVVERLTGRIREAFGQGGRGASMGYMDAQVEGMLLEGRCYQRRRVMGRAWLRGNFWYMSMGGGEERRMPVYVGEELGEALPLFRRFGVRMVAEARARVEQGESSEVALRVVALGRRVAR